MSAPLALTLFHALCDVGNALEGWRERFPPGSDDWCTCTDIIIGINTIIETLVHSSGLGGQDDEA